MSYQQFFKKAQDVKRGEAPPPPPRFKVQSKPTADQVEQRLRASVKMKKARRSSPPPWRAIVGLVFGLGVSAAYLNAPEAFEHLIEHVEVSALGAAGAAEKDSKAAEKAQTAGAAKAKAADAHASDKGPEDKESVAEDLSHFEKLKQRKEELDRREKELSELEEELQRQKVELDKRITQLEDMRNQIAQTLKDRVEVDQEKVTKLVDLYSNMKPKQAADVIGTINEELAVEVLAKMKKKNAAEIMNLLPAEKARVLSEKYTGYRRNHPDSKG